MKNSLKSFFSFALCFVIAFGAIVALSPKSNAYSWYDYWDFYSSSSSSSETHDIYTYEVYDEEATITDCKTSAKGNIKIPSKIDEYSVTEIDSYAFDDCTKITSITIPGSVKTIGYSAFSGCTGLKSITIPDGVTTIENYVFSDCSSLTSVTIPNSVTSIGYKAFCNCKSLTSVTIPDGVTTIEDYVFSECSSLESVNISDSITSIGNGAFLDCTSLANITIPDSVTNIKANAFSNTAYFNDDSNWENDVLYIDNHLIKANENISGSYSIKEGTKNIANCAFEECTSLEEITIPEGITKIRYRAFYDCTSLANVNLPNSLTSIGIDTFYNCTSLTNIDIPDSVTAIGDEAFYGVPNISYSETMEANGSPWCAKAANGFIEGFLVYEDSSKKKIVACGTAATKITISSKTKEIASDAFENCFSIKDVYYRGSNGKNIHFNFLTTTYGVLSSAKWHYTCFHIHCAVLFILFAALIIILIKKEVISPKKCMGFIPILLSLLVLALHNSGKFWKISFTQLFTFTYFPASVLLYLGIILCVILIILPIKAKGKRVCWKHIFVLSTFLFGLFGIDRFVRGQYGLGVIKFLTGGGLLIWACTDFFIAAKKAYGAEYRGIEYFTFVDGNYCKETQNPTKQDEEKTTAFVPEESNGEICEPQD